MMNKLFLFSILFLVVISFVSAETCPTKENFMDRLKDTCSYNNSICEDAETPLVSDCAITPDAIRCNGERCIYNEIWFAKIVLILMILMLVFYKKDNIIFMLLGILFLYMVYSGISLNIPVPTPINTTIAIPQESINDNLLLKYGTKIFPSNPTIGCIIILALLFIILRLIFNWFAVRKNKS